MRVPLVEYLNAERSTAIVRFDDGKDCRVWLAHDGMVNVARYRDSDRYVSPLNERFRAIQDAIRETR